MVDDAARRSGTHRQLPWSLIAGVAMLAVVAGTTTAAHGQPTAGGYVHPSTKLVFPERLGAFRFVTIHEYPDPRYGVAVRYVGPGRADFYLYDAGLSDIPAGIESDLLRHEFAQAERDMATRLATELSDVAKAIDIEPVATHDGQTINLRAVLYTATAVAQTGTRWPIASWLAMTGYRGKLWKLRFTEREADPARSQQALRDLLGAWLEGNVPGRVQIALGADAAAYWVGPWRFGMTREEVSSLAGGVDDRGGGITGVVDFRGKRSKTAFLFDPGGLVALRVVAYDGTDATAARQTCLELYDFFVSRFGGVDLPNVGVSGMAPRDALDITLGVLLERLRAMHEESVKVAARSGRTSDLRATFDMKPRRQPAGSRLHVQFGFDSRGPGFYVHFYQDEPNAADRTAKDPVVVTLN